MAATSSRDRKQAGHGNLVVGVGDRLLCRPGEDFRLGDEVWVHNSFNAGKRWESYVASRGRLTDWRHGRGVDDVILHRVARGRVVKTRRDGYVEVEVVERDGSASAE